MLIEINTQNNVQIVALTGQIDASTAPSITDTILPLIGSNSKILLDMTQVPYMSSAGLRTLLSLYRQITATAGGLVLVGLSEEIQDTMTVTGFLKFFKTSQSVAEGLAILT
ncbi:MAG: anti-sigma factor antagonist [Microcystis aeruginosa BS13-02]|uniref:Anti-sigma factor antagonist n=1 Tax=Microcystis aeruginosa Ma_MB_S_20031200_S102 TaxID=2486254 RepID=A0A552F492_MICAE|nr:anti-sigma factor antagonist [Microcystis aeruginosa BS13-02]TRU23630.1 MAG: STAS domain-containing protein [Microcystis aeruginosa Ma_MB_S_20031200_S102D]TRU41533.1 MAG: STAS domain-containing protein [Microcystis aeruginosa Ma_MB_S_20031200_S102]